MKTAWMFPGQGSQVVGMGSDLFALPAVGRKLRRAKDILGWSVEDVCMNPSDIVSRTLYTQPCLYVIESILTDLLYEQGHKPDLVAGHSLGEYAALYAARVFDFESGLRLVKRRAELMDSASEGVMAAMLGCDRTQLMQQIAETPNVVLANDNNEGQVVISGTLAAVDTIIANVKAKRAVKLNVSGAFHSPLMAQAAAEFRQVLDTVEFATAQVPVLSNVDPTPAIEADELKIRLSQQMTGSVRWREISLRLPEEGMGQAIEVGPGKVLTGLIKRTCPSLALESISSLAEIPVQLVVLN